MIRRLLENHVLANLAFVLVLVLGFLSYKNLPRQQDPTINFNWISVVTALPGASAEDVEKRVTDPLEEAIQGISDLRFVSSNSRENISSLIIRFDDIDERMFDKRIADLRREIDNTKAILPTEAADPFILELTSSSAFPTATIAVTGLADDENLRIQARNIEKDIEQLKGVDRVDTAALDDPEIQIVFDDETMERLNIQPAQVADSLKLWYQDLAAGNANVQNQNWLVRMVGKSNDPKEIGRIPVTGINGEVPLERVASIQRARKKAAQDVHFNGHPAIMLSVLKQDDANMIELVERLKGYIEQTNQLKDAKGVEVVLLDDQTLPTRTAINIMQSNALLGLLFVLFVTWFFLGTRIAFLTAIGIPFILAATFWVLSAIGQTLNISVLLGVVIVLGMLVDDAVVIVEAIYYRLQRGASAIQASLDALKEVALPVMTAVLTTMAAFLPLMLLPGILGKFMLVIPMVVTIALAISLVEAFWMLPAHVTAMNVDLSKPSRVQQMRARMTHWIQVKYSRFLINVLRKPVISILGVFMMFIFSIVVLGSGLIKMDFFASDTLRLFYVNVEMPSTSPMDRTLQKTVEVEKQIKKHLHAEDARSVVSYAGLMFTMTEPLYGDRYGQILVSLNPEKAGMRTVAELIEAMRKDVTAVTGADNISFLLLNSGPPAEKPIQVKVRGDRYEEIQQATDKIYDILNTMGGVKDVSDDASPGRMELTLKPDYDAIRRAGVNPVDVVRTIRLLVDGEVVGDLQDNGEKVEVRVKAETKNRNDISELLNFRLPTATGGSIPLNQLVTQKRAVSLGNIRHYDFKRTITVQADLVKHEAPDFWQCQLKPAFTGEAKDFNQCDLDTVTANDMLKTEWSKVAAQYPGISLDFSGQLDDIQESIGAIGQLFLIGVGLMYLILGTQFKSYFQPMMILSTVPMAFTGVILGLLVTRNPMSLYTLYGVVALAGISVNAAIVLISAANDRLKAGMSLTHATVYAARRRVIPITITSLSTIAGLFSLATGLGGKSLLWGPVATAIVWGVGFSAILTLIAIPTLYRLSMGKRARKIAAEIITKS
jgi:multidrug efflux pump subunit AcrB